MIALNRARVTFDQPGGGTVVALGDLTLEVPTGQFLVVIGTNGSGKSTLLNAIGGKVTLDAGSVTLGKRDVTRVPEWRRAAWIGRVFQNPFQGSCAGLTVAENLHLAANRGSGRRLRVGLSRAAKDRYRARLAEFGMGLEGRLEATAGTLSGGQRQAMTLLMASLAAPEALLLDEHTAALDPRAAEQIMRQTDKLVRTHGLTAVMVTHSMSHALAYGDRTILMHAGRVALDLDSAARATRTIESLVAEFEDLYHREAGDTAGMEGV